MGEDKFKFHESKHLKLSALLYAEVPNATFKVVTDVDFADRKIMRIIFEESHVRLVSRLIKEFSECTAVGNIYKYNKALNELRDALRGIKNGQRL